MPHTKQGTNSWAIQHLHADCCIGVATDEGLT